MAMQQNKATIENRSIRKSYKSALESQKTKPRQKLNYLLSVKVFDSWEELAIEREKCR